MKNVLGIANRFTTQKKKIYFLLFGYIGQKVHIKELERDDK